MQWMTFLALAAAAVVTATPQDSTPSPGEKEVTSTDVPPATQQSAPPSLSPSPWSPLSPSPHLSLHNSYPSLPAIYISPNGHVSGSAANFASGFTRGVVEASPFSPQSSGYSFGNLAPAASETSATNFADLYSNGAFGFSNPVGGNLLKGLTNSAATYAPFNFGAYSLENTGTGGRAANSQSATTSPDNESNASKTSAANQSPSSPLSFGSSPIGGQSGGTYGVNAALPHSFTFPGSLSVSPYFSYSPLHSASGVMDAFGAQSAHLPAPLRTTPLYHARGGAAAGPASTAPVTFAPARSAPNGGAMQLRPAHALWPAAAPGLPLRLHTPTATLFHRPPTFLGHVNGVPTWSFPLQNAGTVLHPRGPATLAGPLRQRAPYALPPPVSTVPPTPPTTKASPPATHEDTRTDGDDSSSEEEDEEEADDEDGEKEDLEEHERDHEELRQRIKEWGPTESTGSQRSSTTRPHYKNHNYHSSRGSDNKIPYGSKSSGSGSGGGYGNYKSYSAPRRPSGGRFQNYEDDHSSSGSHGHRYSCHSGGGCEGGEGDEAGEEGWASFGPFRLPLSLRGEETALRPRPFQRDNFQEESNHNWRQTKGSAQRAPYSSKGSFKDSAWEESSPSRARVVEYNKSSKTVDFSLETKSEKR